MAYDLIDSMPEVRASLESLLEHVAMTPEEDTERRQVRQLVFTALDYRRAQRQAKPDSCSRTMESQ